MLVIGFGAGVTAGAVSIEPRLERVTIAEIEPLVPVMASQHFGKHNFDVYKNPKTRLVLDDGRHFLQTKVRRHHPRIRSTRGSRARPRSTPASSSKSVKRHLNPAA